MLNAYKLPHLQHGYRNFLKEWALMENMATYGEQKKKKKAETCSTIEISDMLQCI